MPNPSDSPTIEPAPQVTDPAGESISVPETETAVKSPPVPETETAVKSPPVPETETAVKSPSVSTTKAAVESISSEPVEPAKESLKADNPIEEGFLNPEVAAAINIAKTAILDNIPEALRGLAKDKSLQDLSAWVDSKEYKIAKEALLSANKPVDLPNPNPPKVDVPPNNDNPPPSPKTFSDLTDAHYAEFAKAII